jgi:hypothetical protein
LNIFNSNFQQIAPNDLQKDHIKSEVLEVAEIDGTIARKTARAFLTSKHFPTDLRPLLWSKLIPNPTNINKKWFDAYLKILAKRE